MNLPVISSEVLTELGDKLANDTSELEELKNEIIKANPNLSLIIGNSIMMIGGLFGKEMAASVLAHILAPLKAIDMQLEADPKLAEDFIREVQ